jgi:hypothetical protein
MLLNGIGGKVSVVVTLVGKRRRLRISVAD